MKDELIAKICILIVEINMYLLSIEEFNTPKGNIIKEKLRQHVTDLERILLKLR